MNKLYILYDAQNPFCLRCRKWLAEERALVPLEFIPYQAPEQAAKFQGLKAYLGKNFLLAVSDDGAVYEGPQAFVMCLYALEKYRDWAARLASPSLLPFAAAALDLFASCEGKIPRWLSELGDEELGNLLSFQQESLKTNPTPDKDA